MVLFTIEPNMHAMLVKPGRAIQTAANQTGAPAGKGDKMFAQRFSPALAAALAFTAVLSAAPATEAARVDVRQLTCQQAGGLVQQQGKVLMNFTNTTYDLVVRQPFLCRPGDVGERKWVQTLDSPRCYVGYICKPNHRDPLGNDLEDRW